MIKQACTEVAGLYSPAHFIYLFFLTIFIVFSVFLVKKYGQSKVRHITMIVSVIVTLLEIVKIGYLHYMDVVVRGLEQPNIHSWVPLSFCSLFIYSTWLMFFKSEFIRKIGTTFIITGGLFAGVAFLIYPSTAVGLYPPLSFLSIHGMVYHALMVFVGIINLLFNSEQPTIKNFKYYLIFCLVMFSIAITLSYLLDINLMFFMDPFALPQLVKDIFHFNKYLYMLLVGVAYLSLYFVSLVLYLITTKIKTNLVKKKAL